jgi:hypothetical protein
MFKKTALLVVGAFMVPFATSAAEVPIVGTVESRCIIQTDTTGTYGNPNAYTLTTTPAEGGDPATVRFDITLADAYYAEITPPQSFSSSPSLPDVATFTGDVSVGTVSDATGMGTYETDKVIVGDTHRYDLTATGSTWFDVESTVTMGGNKAFAGGTYTAVAEAVCIAK